MLAEQNALCPANAAVNHRTINGACSLLVAACTQTEYPTAYVPQLYGALSFTSHINGVWTDANSKERDVHIMNARNHGGEAREVPVPFWLRFNASTQTATTPSPQSPILNTPSTHLLRSGDPSTTTHRRTPGPIGNNNNKVIDPSRRLILSASPEKDQCIAVALVESGICEFSSS